MSLTIFILLINSRIGHEDQQSLHDRVYLKYTVIFLAPLVHTGLLLADITSTPHNPTLSRYLIEPPQCKLKLLKNELRKFKSPIFPIPLYVQVNPAHKVILTAEFIARL